MALDPSVLIEGVGGSAAAAGFVGMRRRAPRVRRDPIDIQLVAAETAEAAETDESLDADEILAALEAEVTRTAEARPAPEPQVVVAPEPAPRAPEPVGPVASAPRSSSSNAGIAADQVSAWLERVEDDLRKVRARMEYLHHEQARLEAQQSLVTELLTSSTPL